MAKLFYAAAFISKIYFTLGIYKISYIHLRPFVYYNPTSLVRRSAPQECVSEKLVTGICVYSTFIGRN